MSTFLVGKLAAALKAVAKQVDEKQAERLPILKNALLVVRDGALCLATTDLESWTMARVGFRGDDLPTTTMPAKLLAEVLASYDKGGTVEVEITERTSTMTLTHAMPGSSVKMRTSLKGWIAFDFPAPPWPAEWPEENVVVVRNCQAEVSRKDWLYWVHDYSLAGFVPAKGKRITFPGVSGVFFGIGAGEFTLTDGATGLAAGNAATLAEHQEFLIGKGDPDSVRAKCEAVPAHLPTCELPKWGNALLKALKVALGPNADDSDTLGALGEKLGEKLLGYLQNLVAHRMENRATWAAKCQAEREEHERQEKLAKEFEALRKEVFAHCFAEKIARKVAPDGDSDAVLAGAEMFCDKVSFSSTDFKTKFAIASALREAYQMEADSVLAVVNGDTEPTETPLAPEPEDLPPTPAPVRELYADLPPAMVAVMPHLEPYADSVLGVGGVLWVKAADKTAAQALAKAGFKFAPTLGAWHSKIESAGRLPVVAAPQAPRRVAWREYSREPIRL